MNEFESDVKFYCETPALRLSPVSQQQVSSCSDSYFTTLSASLSNTLQHVVESNSMYSNNDNDRGTPLDAHSPTIKNDSVGCYNNYLPSPKKETFVFANPQYNSFETWNYRSVHGLSSSADNECGYSSSNASSKSSIASEFDWGHMSATIGQEFLDHKMDDVKLEDLDILTSSANSNTSSKSNTSERCFSQQQQQRHVGSFRNLSTELETIPENRETVLHTTNQPLVPPVVMKPNRMESYNISFPTRLQPRVRNDLWKETGLSPVSWNPHLQGSHPHVMPYNHQSISSQAQHQMNQFSTPHVVSRNVSAPLVGGNSASSSFVTSQSTPESRSSPYNGRYVNMSSSRQISQNEFQPMNFISESDLDNLLPPISLACSGPSPGPVGGSSGNVSVGQCSSCCSQQAQQSMQRSVREGANKGGLIKKSTHKRSRCSSPVFTGGGGSDSSSSMTTPSSSVTYSTIVAAPPSTTTSDSSSSLNTHPSFVNQNAVVVESPVMVNSGKRVSEADEDDDDQSYQLTESSLSNDKRAIVRRRRGSLVTDVSPNVVNSSNVADKTTGEVVSSTTSSNTSLREEGKDEDVSVDFNIPRSNTLTSSDMNALLVTTPQVSNHLSGEEGDALYYTLDEEGKNTTSISSVFKIDVRERSSGDYFNKQFVPNINSKATTFPQFSGSDSSQNGVNVGGCRSVVNDGQGMTSYSIVCCGGGGCGGDQVIVPTPTPSTFTSSRCTTTTPSSSSIIRNESKRRENLKSLLDQLHTILLSSERLTDEKASQATVMFESGRLIQHLVNENKRRGRLIWATKHKIQELNQQIEFCQGHLPATGAAIGIPLGLKRLPTLSDHFSDHVVRSTMRNWRYWVFVHILGHFVHSFDVQVTAVDYKSLETTALEWITNNLSLNQLRKDCYRKLAKLTSKTSIMETPELLCEEARAFVSRNQKQYFKQSD